MGTKFKKVSSGVYEAIVNGVLVELLKQENKTWLLIHGCYGDENYWTETYDSKKQAIDDFNKN